MSRASRFRFENVARHAGASVDGWEKAASISQKIMYSPSHAIGQYALRDPILSERMGDN